MAPDKERQLLRAMGRIVRAVGLQNDLARLRVRGKRVRAKPVDAELGQPRNGRPRQVVLPRDSVGCEPSAVASPRPAMI